MKKIIKLFCVLCAVASCSDSNEIGVFKLRKTVEVNQLSDSTFLTDVRSIRNYKEKFYLTDYSRNQIIILDKTLKLINTMGSTGKGPGEFLGADQLYIEEDTIYVMNDGHRTIEVFDRVKHLKTIKFPNSIKLAADKKFVKSDEYFYLSKVDVDGSVCKYGFDKIVKQFGLIENYKSEKETFIKNQKHILKYKNNIISVSDNKPKLEMYTTSGDLVYKLDYGNIELVDNTMDFIEKQTLTENSYYEFVSDAYVFSNKLYLLILTHDGQKMFSNKVLEFDINDVGFTVSRILDLGDDWFESICASNDILMASNGALVSFKLN